MLAPPVMAVLGVGPAGLLAAVAAAVLLARLLRDSAHPLAGALLGAVFSAADVLSGRTTFALGAVAALGALLCRQRRGRAVALAVLTALLSPVAAAFLGLAAAVLVLHRRPGGWPLGLAAAVPVGLVTALFPSGGVQPFVRSSAWPGVAAGLALAVLTAAPLLRTGGVLYAAAVVVFALSADPFGSNILRLALLLAAPLVVATSSRRWLLVAPVAVLLVQWQLRPTYTDLRAAPAPPFAALRAELARLGVQRVEVVPLLDHGESARVPPVVPLARGWSRQIDRHENALFYEGQLTAPAFRAWLLAARVDAVALSASRLDIGGRRERTLLDAGPVPGLVPVYDDGTWRVWRVAGARPLVDPPAVVVSAGRAQLDLHSTGPAIVGVDLRWSRWLSVHGPACLARDGDRTVLRLHGAGPVRVSSSLLPHGHC